MKRRKETGYVRSGLSGGKETDMTEKEKMLRGELYRTSDPELVAEHRRALRLCREYNDIDPMDDAEMDRVIRELVNVEGKQVTVKQPIRFDYGCHTYFGENVFINYGVNILDVCDVRLGDNVLLGPNVQIIAATHPTDPKIRLMGLECGKPVTIGANVWLGAGVTVCPGVTIGENTTIGAGSVVTKDIPANCVAVGNPCRVLKKV